MENYYKILDVHPNATQAEIKERFRFLANAYHPDKFANTEHKARAEEEFKKINEAYQILSVPAKRAEHDRRLGLARSSNSSQARRYTQPRRQQAPNQPPNIQAVGQAIVRMIAFAFVVYLLSFLALRIGFGGVIMVLILLGLLYARYFWK